jgi:hypothetical protein
VITEKEIKDRLVAAIERREQPEARERMAKWGVLAIVPEVLKIVREEVSKATRENIGLRRDVE